MRNTYITSSLLMISVVDMSWKKIIKNMDEFVLYGDANLSSYLFAYI